MRENNASSLLQVSVIAAAEEDLVHHHQRAVAEPVAAPVAHRRPVVALPRQRVPAELQQALLQAGVVPGVAAERRAGRRERVFAGRFDGADAAPADGPLQPGAAGAAQAVGHQSAGVVARRAVGERELPGPRHGELRDLLERAESVAEAAARLVPGTLSRDAKGQADAGAASPHLPLGGQPGRRGRRGGREPAQLPPRAVARRQQHERVAVEDPAADVERRDRDAALVVLVVVAEAGQPHREPDRQLVPEPNALGVAAPPVQRGRERVDDRPGRHADPLLESDIEADDALADRRHAKQGLDARGREQLLQLADENSGPAEQQREHSQSRGVAQQLAERLERAEPSEGAQQAVAHQNPAQSLGQDVADEGRQGGDAELRAEAEADDAECGEGDVERPEGAGHQPAIVEREEAAALDAEAGAVDAEADPAEPEARAQQPKSEARTIPDQPDRSDDGAKDAGRRGRHRRAGQKPVRLQSGEATREEE